MNFIEQAIVSHNESTRRLAATMASRARQLRVELDDYIVHAERAARGEKSWAFNRFADATAVLDSFAAQIEEKRNQRITLDTLAAIASATAPSPAQTQGRDK